MKDARFHARMIANAQVLFKLAFSFSATRSTLKPLAMFTSYRHTVAADDLRLTKNEEDQGFAIFEHVAIYTLATQIDTALGAVCPDRFKTDDAALQGAAWIARLIRNAFAHNPFAPQWQTYPECDHREFVVPGVITLNTSDRQGQFVRQRDYGGPLALWKLSEFVQERLRAIVTDDQVTVKE